MNSHQNGAAPERVDFSKIKTSIPIPNLIEVQKKSYERFLQMELLPSERDDAGLQTVFNSVFPISDFRGVSRLEFVDYSIGLGMRAATWGLHHLRSTCATPCSATICTDHFTPACVVPSLPNLTRTSSLSATSAASSGPQLKYDMVECQERGADWPPTKVTIHLTVYAKGPETGAKRTRYQRAGSFFGEIPLMTAAPSSSAAPSV
jgi:DNA-directed RNA polymerase subunit beta